ncbi:MAG: DUF748 domain-containing protein [Candidatus Omnitrophica bacterium]|nr:DUF748 domain-containing protein [Candidatus Omnitrophota bacterium]
MLKGFLKFILGFLVVIFVLVATASLFLNIYGKQALADTLSNMVGSQVQFESVGLNLGQPGFKFKGFKVASKIDFEENAIDAEKFTIILDEAKLKKEKKFAIKEIIIEKGTLNLIRDKNGIFSVSRIEPGKIHNGRGLAYAAVTDEESGFYKLVNLLKKMTLKDLQVRLKDHYVASVPLEIIFDDFDLNLTCLPQTEYGFVPLICTGSADILNAKYGNGKASLKSNISVLKHSFNTETTLQTNNIDLTQFLPYFEKSTPFKFSEGLFSSTTQFNMHNSQIDSLTTIVFQKLNLMVDPGKENAKFLEASVNRLAPYLMSGEGNINFDFIISGAADNPEIGLGPKVKFAIGRVAIEELSNFIQQLQKLHN